MPQVSQVPIVTYVDGREYTACSRNYLNCRVNLSRILLDRVVIKRWHIFHIYSQIWHSYSPTSVPCISDRNLCLTPLCDCIVSSHGNGEDSQVDTVHMSETTWWHSKHTPL